MRAGYFLITFSLGSCFYVFCLCFVEVDITRIRCWVIKKWSRKPWLLAKINL